MSFRIAHKASAAAAILVAMTLASFSCADDPIDMDSAARAYRIRVYRTFRMNRPEYDRRIQVGKEVLSAWTGGGSPAEEQEVYRWFLAAAEASTTGTVSQLPVLAAMDTLNSRRTAYNNEKKRKRKDAVRKSFVHRQRMKQPAVNPVTRHPKAPVPRLAEKPGGGFSNLMGQLVNQGMNLVGGNGSSNASSNAARNMPTPATPNLNAPSEFGGNNEQLVKLAAENGMGNDAEYEAAVQSINETIIGQNLVVEEVRSQLKSEWDFDPKSAEELLSNLESIGANEREIARRIGELPPAYHTQVDALVSVNELLGDVNERLMALKSGSQAFADEGFGADEMQALEDRLEKLRVDLKL